MKGGESRPAPGVYLARRRPFYAGSHTPDASFRDADVHELAVQTGSAQDQVIHGHA